MHVGGSPEAMIFFLAGRVGQNEMVVLAIDNPGDGVRIL